jgi:hypothetical protein
MCAKSAARRSIVRDPRSPENRASREEAVHEALQQTRTKEVIAWIKTKLGDTVRSTRQIAYRAAKAALMAAKESKGATKPGL